MKMRIALLLASISMIVLRPAPAEAAIEPRDILKTFFETGDVPTQDQFANLIDSFIHQTDDGLTLIGIGGDLNGPRHLNAGAILDGSLTFTAPGSQLPLAANWRGQSGFLPLEYQDSAGQPHFGFLEMSMDAAASPPATTPAINVQHWAWETTANTAVVATPVPEPASMGLLAMLGAALLRQRRRRS
jgi:hypothetical protein